MPTATGSAASARCAGSGSCASTLQPARRASRTTSSSPAAAWRASSSTGRCWRTSRSTIRPPSARSPSRRRVRSVPAQAQASSQIFLNQAAQCEGRSPLYADLLRRYAEDPVAALIVGPEPAWDAPLRLLAGLHFLVLGGRAQWDDPLEQHRGFLSDFVATQGVQTNEVQRSWVLLPLLLRVAQRMGAASF